MLCGCGCVRGCVCGWVWVEVPPSHTLNTLPLPSSCGCFEERASVEIEGPLLRQPLPAGGGEGPADHSSAAPHSLTQSSSSSSSSSLPQLHQLEAHCTTSVHDTRFEQAVIHVWRMVFSLLVERDNRSTAEVRGRGGEGRGGEERGGEEREGGVYVSCLHVYLPYEACICTNMCVRCVHVYIHMYVRTCVRMFVCISL